MRVERTGVMQKSFADLEYAAKRKTTRRERFLAELERITPWSELLAALAPFYPKGEGRGRPPIALERMLRCTSCSKAWDWPTKESKTRSTTARPSTSL